MNLDYLDAEKCNNIYYESLELEEEFNKKLKWVKNGFLWCYSLTNRQRQVIYLRIFMNKSFSDIGIILKIKPSTVRNHWRQALNSLNEKNLLFDE